MGIKRDLATLDHALAGMRRNPAAAPSSRALSRWFDAQPDGDYTCTDCGRVGPKHYVQPQHPYYAEGRTGTALCTDCTNRHNAEARAARRRALAEEPRCAAAPCSKRGAWNVAGVLLCGGHKRRVQNAYGRMGVWAGVAEYDRESILRAAQRDGTVRNPGYRERLEAAAASVADQRVAERRARVQHLLGRDRRPVCGDRDPMARTTPHAARVSCKTCQRIRRDRLVDAYRADR